MRAGHSVGLRLIKDPPLASGRNDLENDLENDSEKASIARDHRAIDVENLAGVLIERCCHPHSIGQVYGFLLRACPDATTARSEFERYIAGELPERLLSAAARCVEQDQERAGRNPGASSGA